MILDLLTVKGSKEDVNFCFEVPLPLHLPVFALGRLCGFTPKAVMPAHLATTRF
jgi:hypothetical protein